MNLCYMVAPHILIICDNAINRMSLICHQQGLVLCNAWVKKRNMCRVCVEEFFANREIVKVLVYVYHAIHSEYASMTEHKTSSKSKSDSSYNKPHYAPQDNVAKTVSVILTHSCICFYVTMTSCVEVYQKHTHWRCSSYIFL